MSEFEKDLANVMGSFIETELDCVEKQNQEIEQLQQENKQLKDKINTYENPEDLTLMFMYCDEKAKDKIKELKEENKKIKIAITENCDLRLEVLKYKEVIEEVNKYIEDVKAWIEEEYGEFNNYYFELNADTVKKILDKVKE